MYWVGSVTVKNNAKASLTEVAVRAVFLCCSIFWLETTGVRAARERERDQKVMCGVQSRWYTADEEFSRVFL